MYTSAAKKHANFNFLNTMRLSSETCTFLQPFIAARDICLLII